MFPTAVKLTKIDTGEVFCFNSIYQACKKLNINRSSVRKVLDGTQKQTKGYLVSEIPIELAHPEFCKIIQGYIDDYINTILD